MRVLKRCLQIGIPTAVFLGAVMSTMLLLQAYSKGAVYEITPAVSSHPPTRESKVAREPGLPVRLRIPKINVDAAIEGLGLTPEGDLGSPEGPDTTGWYNAGPRPGAPGSAVIDGHFGWANNKPAVFDDLHTLQKGDTLSVEDSEKNITTFIVSEMRIFRAEDDATAVFRSSDGRAHLNLITCQGVWNKYQASYSTRLVVFADIVED